MKKVNNILFITQWQFNDALVQTYTLPYVKIIKELSVFNKLVLIVFNKHNSKINEFNWEGVKVIELPFEYITFSDFYSIYRYIKKIVIAENITHLHPWCTTAGTFGMLLKKYHNSNLHLVIDSFEPHAEAMVENGEWSKFSIKYKFLFWCEKMQVKHANHLIFAADGMQDYIYTKFKQKVNSFDVKPACVDLQMFNTKDELRKSYREELNLSDKVVCVYAGKLGGIYLNDEIFLFVKECVLFWGEKFRFLLLSAMPNDELKKLCLRYAISEQVFVKRFVPHQQVPGYLNAADFGICPVKPIPSKRYCSPIKNGEYWATGLPVVITKDISTDSDLIEKQEIGVVWKQLNSEEFKKSVIKISQILNSEHKLTQNKIRSVAEEHRTFDIARRVYGKIYYICENT